MAINLQLEGSTRETLIIHMLIISSLFLCSLILSWLTCYRKWDSKSHSFHLIQAKNMVEPRKSSENHLKTFARSTQAVSFIFMEELSHLNSNGIFTSQREYFKEMFLHFQTHNAPLRDLFWHQFKTQPMSIRTHCSRSYVATSLIGSKQFWTPLNTRVLLLIGTCPYTAWINKRTNIFNQINGVITINSVQASTVEAHPMKASKAKPCPNCRSEGIKKGVVMISTVIAEPNRWHVGLIISLKNIFGFCFTMQYRQQKV